MKKVIKIGFPIACIAIIGGTFYMLGNLDRRVDDSLRSQYSNSVNTTNEVQESEDENLVQEDVTYTVPVSTDDEETNTSEEGPKNTENVTDEENENTSNMADNEDDENISNNINE